MATYQKSFATRAKIIHEACNLFCQKGYESTTTREIAEASGISRGNLQYHFPNKIDIAKQIGQEFIDNLFLEIREILFHSVNDLILRDTIHLNCFISVFLSDNPYTKFYHELGKMNLLSELLINSNIRHYIEQADYLKLHIDKRILIGYSTIFVSTMVSLIMAKKDRKIMLSNDEIYESCHIVHLSLLKMDQTKIREYIRAAKQYSDRIGWEMNSLTEIKVKQYDQTI
ncbi:MAG: TetR/AcrR family transcriptional regulator [Anaerofustis sp.]